jgi:hypothetical protein
MAYGTLTLIMVGAEIVKLLDLAAEHIPGWRELTDGSLSVPEFRRVYLHSATAGLHVIANTLAAALVAGVDPAKVVAALAELPWRRDALRTIPENKAAGVTGYAVHSFFEGTLAKTVKDDKKLIWHASASAATRAGYESAIKTVLRHIAAEHPDLKEINSDVTLTQLGLIARQSVGRPRKVVTQ